MKGAPAKPISGTVVREVRLAPSRSRRGQTASPRARRAPAALRRRGPSAHGCADAGPGLNVTSDAHGRQRHEDVGKQDGGVHVQAAHGLHRDLARQLRRPAAGEEVGLLAKRAIFGQVAAGLAHDPDRRAFDALLAAGARKQRVAHRTASSDSATAAPSPRCRRRCVRPR